MSKLIVISGFSGAGKDSVMNGVLELKPSVKRIVTYTSRPIRENEKEGVDYNFITNRKFESLLAKNYFLEHVKYGSHYKGTSKEDFLKVLNGESFIWRIDMSRLTSVENTFESVFEPKIANNLIERTVKIFIRAENQKSYLDRYKGREHNPNEQEFVKRLRQDTEIWKTKKDLLGNILVNRTGQLNNTIQEVLRIIG